MWHISYHNSASEQSLNKHSFQFGNDADRLTAAKTNRDQGSSSYNLCMLVVRLRSKRWSFSLFRRPFSVSTHQYIICHTVNVTLQAPKRQTDWLFLTH